MFKKSLIAAVAALTIAASMASPAQALSKNGALALGLGLGTVAAIGIASAHDRGGYYGYDGYYAGGYYPAGGYGYGYRRENRGYRYWARECADRFGWETRRWNRCMDRHGF